MGKLQTAFVIGAGRMGRRHVEISRRAGLNVIGVHDHNVNSLGSARIECGIESQYLFDDFASMCASAVPDYAVVATTTPSHCEFGVALAKHGVKFLMIEKPFGSSILECEELVHQCDETATRLAVNHFMRQMPLVKQVKRLLQSDLLGGFTSLAVTGGNSGLAMMGSHFIDIFNFFSDSSIETVSAWLSNSDVTNPRGAEYSDPGGIVVIHTAAGQRLVLNFPIDQGQGLEILACGRYGMLRFDIGNGTIDGVARHRQDRELPLTRSDLKSEIFNSDLGVTDYLEMSTTHVKNLLLGGDIVDGAQAIQVISVLVAAYASNELGNTPQVIENLKKYESRKFMWA